MPALILVPALACTAAAAADPAPTAESFAVHGEFTYVEQEDPAFNDPYAGKNSLTPDQGRETTDASVSIGAALWTGAQAWIDAELDQGFGLNDTLGVAGFPSGEAYKVGSSQPYFRLQRAFIRQTFDGSGPREPVAGSAGTLAGEQSANRWVFTVGKFAVTDVFDNNQYAHDPRADFLNWAAIDAGAFDYAADAWGYTVGAAVERYQGPWTLRAGVFDLSNVPNSPRLAPGFDEFQLIGELEHRHSLGGHAGKLLFTGFESRGRMGLLDQALQVAAVSGRPPDAADVRSYRGRFGAALMLEQELATNLGLFVRISKATGNVEAYEFSDIDRSVSAGLSLQGAQWGRANDTIGVALIDSAISAERQAYLAAGGLGILVGDGRLPHPGPEQIAETYYSAAIGSWIRLTLDYQRIENPAYNQDRGPVSVFAVRVHAQF